MSRFRSPTVALLLIALTAVFPTAPASAASLKGKVKKGVYESPAKNFRVPVPAGLGMRVNDGFQRAGPEAGDVGAVSFHDDLGALRMITYMSLDRVPAFPDSATECRTLEAFIRDVAMPTWFVPASQESKILEIAPASFEGKRAVLALVSLPGASPLVDAKTGKRMDSTRGLITFYHGRWVFLLGTETKALWSAVADSTKPAPPDDAWTRFTGGLAAFFRTIVFTE